MYYPEVSEIIFTIIHLSGPGRDTVLRCLARDSGVKSSLVVSRSVTGCYVASCVPEFIGCARRSRTRTSFDMCKYEHRACAMRCWELAHESTGM
ncbi:hypothetical protein BaRGS_00031416 [Batillaria attramentaria]|uniref:Uncharacterized protein n=1 Tax=Batillaria attramentaria TaxID=370345 RepID=A0ABD0JQJ3_9CAEN